MLGAHVVAAALCPGVLRAPVPPSLESCGGGSRSVVHVHGLHPAAFAERLSCAMSVGLAASARICMYGADVGLACRRPCESYAASAEHMCKCLLYVPVSSRWGSSLVSRPNYMRERVEKVVRPSRTRSLSSRPSAPGSIERTDLQPQTRLFEASERSQLPGSNAFGRTGDWTRSQMADQSEEMATRVGLWRQSMRWLRLKERRAAGKGTSLIRLRKLKLRMTRTWSNLL